LEGYIFLPRPTFRSKLSAPMQTMLGEDKMQSLGHQR
jgi:hypothetical protein